MSEENQNLPEKGETEPEPLFINETLLNSDTYVKVGISLTKKKRAEILALGITVVLIGLALLLLYVLYLHKSEGVIPWALFIIGGTLIAYCCIYKKLLRKKVNEQIKGHTLLIRYFFTDDGFEFEGISNTSSVSGESKNKGSFSAFCNCSEYEKFWLLYYNKNSYDIISKDGMKKGDVHSFKEFLAEKLGEERYKVCFKKHSDK